jgi:uncharacterized protein YbaP (TraB family)
MMQWQRPRCCERDYQSRARYVEVKRVVVFVTLAAALGGGCRKHSDALPGAPNEGARPATPARATPPREKLRRPLFWSAEKAGKTTYFLGTMHSGIDAEAQLPAIVWSRLDGANAFAMEADLDDPAAAAMIKPTATSLRDALGDAYWKKLEDALGAGTARAVEHLPPLVPAAELSLRGLPPTVEMDKALSARAASEHKRLVYLEPATRQLEILGKWMDVRALKVQLDELDENEQRMRALLDAYVAGDERRIVEISDGEKADALQHGYTAAEYDQEMNEVLYDRNAAWIGALEQLHAHGGGFVAVGALHLLGRRSVLELLAQRGYQVTRIVPDDAR